LLPVVSRCLGGGCTPVCGCRGMVVSLYTILFVGSYKSLPGEVPIRLLVDSNRSTQ